MRLHGAGIWGVSSANQTGHNRITCPICKKIFVKGSKNRHNENYQKYVDMGKMGIRLITLDEPEPQNVWFCPNRGK